VGRTSRQGGYGIYVNGDARISDEVSVESLDDAVYVWGGYSPTVPPSLTIEGGSFSSSGASALFAGGEASVTVEGGSFASRRSCALYVATDATVRVNGGDFSVSPDEDRVDRAAAVWAGYDSAVTITGGNFCSGGDQVFVIMRNGQDEWPNPSFNEWGAISVEPAYYGAVKLDAAEGVVMASAFDLPYAEAEVPLPPQLVDVPDGTISLGAGTCLATDELAVQAWDYMIEGLTIDEDNVIWYVADDVDDKDAASEVAEVTAARRSAAPNARGVVTSKAAAAATGAALPQTGDVTGAALAVLAAAGMALAAARTLRRRS